MRKFPAAWLMILLLVLGMVSAAALASDIEENADSMTIIQSGEAVRYAKVATKKGTLNMRAKAQDNAEIIYRLPRGTIVQITQDLDGWAQVLYKGRSGFVMSSFIEEYTEFPYNAITKDSDGDAIRTFKKAMYKLGYLKSDEINKRFDAAMEKALVKLQLINNVALNPEAVSPELQALMEWGMVLKSKSGYTDTATDKDSGLTVSIYCWDSDGFLYEKDKSMKLEISYGAQATGGQPPYAITVKKSLGGGVDYADEVPNPFSHVWTPTTECLYLYATVVDAAGNTATACTPFRYTLPARYQDK